jgi:polyhydroxyalkanoate synthesis regulator phasin
MTGINKLSAVVATIFLTAALGLSACDSSTVDTDTTASLDESSGELMSVLVADIGLTSTQQAQVAAMFEKHGDAQHEPGFLWPVAADLQQRLTDEQKQRLFDKAAAGPGEGTGQGFGQRFQHQSGSGFGGQGGFQHQDRRGGDGFGPLADILTDAQKEQAQTIRESVRAELEALKASVAAGEITAEEARATMQELRESVREQIEALLTDEQKAELEALRAEREAEREARREEARLVRNDVLGLDADEAAAFDAISEGNRATAEALREQVRNGEITRDEAHAAMLTLRDERNTQLAAMLDETQLEIVQIHDALQMRMRHHGLRGQGSDQGGRRSGPGGGQGGQFGSGSGFGSRG